MDIIRIKTVNQIPPPLFDLNEVIRTIIYTIGGIWGSLKGMSYYFRDKEKERLAKAQEKTEFIESVVTKTMNGVLREFRADFHEFKNKTEQKMDDFNETVLKIYTEVKK